MLNDKGLTQAVEKVINKAVRPELDKLRAKIEEQEKRISDHMAEQNERFNNFAHKVFTFLEDQDRKIAKLAQDIDDKFNKLFSTLDFILKRVEGLEAEYYAITQTLKRIEEKLAVVEERERIIQELQQRINELQAKTLELEKRISQLGL